MSTVRNNEVATFPIVCKSMEMAFRIKQSVMDGFGVWKVGVPLQCLNSKLTLFEDPIIVLNCPLAHSAYAVLSTDKNEGMSGGRGMGGACGNIKVLSSTLIFQH